MSRRIGHSGNCRGCLYFTKPLIVCKEEGAIVHQRPSDASAELVAHEWRDGTCIQIKGVSRIVSSISFEFEYRPMRVIGSGLCFSLDAYAPIPSLLLTLR